MALPNEAAPTAPQNSPTEAAPAQSQAPAAAPQQQAPQAPAAAPAAPQQPATPSPAGMPAPAQPPADPVKAAADRLVASGVRSIREAIDKSDNPGLYEELINMTDDQLRKVEEQYLAQTGKSSTTPTAPTGGSPNAGAPAPAAPGTPAPADDREETVTLKRSELGTYAAKDRPLKDAIQIGRAHV